MAPEDYDLATTSFLAFEPTRLATMLLPIWTRETAAGVQTGLVTDSDVLKALEPRSDHTARRGDTQRISRLYLQSFVWRHAAVWLALALESRNQKTPLRLAHSPHSPFVHHQSALADCLDQGHASCLGLHLSLSARGLEWRRTPEHQCAHFDPYEPKIFCPNAPVTRGGNCAQHSPSIWHSPAQDPKPLQAAVFAPSLLDRHQTMMAFYGDFRNLRAYSGEELEALVEHFWRRVLQSQRSSSAALVRAACGLGYPSLADVREAGTGELRKRYRNMALAHHPDRGGKPSAFQTLTDAFTLLNNYLHNKG